jgi:hypothetical protein
MKTPILRFGKGGNVQRLPQWLMPNGGAILLLFLFVLTQNVWARPAQETSSASVSVSSPNATTVHYQGHLSNAQGNPLNNNVNLSFTLYDAMAGGSAVWGPEIHANVPVSNGVFTVGLGSVLAGGFPMDILINNIYLEIAVNGETLSPREPIRSVPIAGLALTVPDGSIPSSALSLASGQVCVSESSVEIALPGNWETVPIPGLVLNFSLERPSKVLVWMNGLSMFDDSGAGANYVELVVDGVSQIANHSHLDLQWDDVKGQRLFDFSAGPHELFMQGRAKYAGTMTIHGDAQWKTCLYYLVLGQ